VDRRDELTDGERDALVQHTARSFLEKASLPEFAPATIRGKPHPMWQQIADAMDAESAAHEARAAFRVLNGERRLSPIGRASRGSLKDVSG
jgi:hypothetical protein